MSKRQSPALKLMLMTYRECCDEAPFSWDRMNTAMSRAMRIAISGGFRFNEGDFREIPTQCLGCYWRDLEGCYATAVADENMSAIKAFEAEYGRVGFIADNVTDGCGNWSHFGNTASTRKRGRLAVGSEFPWKGEKACVTSFAADNSYFTACSYDITRHPTKYYVTSKKILHRYKITREMIIADRAERKAGA